MTSIILAGVLGAVTITTVVLLFRRLKEDLNRQLTALRAEHDSEWIKRAITSAPNGTTTPSGGSVQAAAANGEHLNPPPPWPDPLKGQKPLVSKRHLHLLPPIAAAALALTEFLREAWREHRGYVFGTAIGATAAGAAAVTVLTIAPWSDDADHQPPFSAPTAAPTITLPPPTYIWPPQPAPGESGPSQTPSPSGSPSALAPSPSASALPSEFRSPSPAPGASVLPIGEEPTAAPGPTQPGPGPSDEVPSEPATEDPLAPSSPSPSGAPVGSRLCVGVTVSPVLDVGVCLPFLGGG